MARFSSGEEDPRIIFSGGRERTRVIRWDADHRENFAGPRVEGDDGALPRAESTCGCLLNRRVDGEDDIAPGRALPIEFGVKCAVPARGLLARKHPVERQLDALGAVARMEGADEVGGGGIVVTPRAVSEGFGNDTPIPVEYAAATGIGEGREDARIAVFLRQVRAKYLPIGQPTDDASIRPTAVRPVAESRRSNPSDASTSRF